MDKLEYEMNKVAKKAAKEAAKKAKMKDAKDTILMLKRAGQSITEIFQELSASPNYSKVLTKDEFKQLIKENYQ